MIVFSLLAIICLPVGNLLLTKLGEDTAAIVVPVGYADDASHLNQTPIAQRIDVAKGGEAIVEQLRRLLKTAKDKRQKISIAGARHSMGGHTLYPNGIVLNMLPYNQLSFDAKSNILTVGSGALWSDIIAYLDKYGKSVAIMQALSSFSVGGSISVNGHGWQKSSPPISASVVSFTLMNHNGEIINCSREENAELFQSVIGGYGLFGVILDVKLRVVDNVALKYKNFIFPRQQYLDYYQKYVTNNAGVNLVYGRLDISDKHFLDEATLNIYEKTTAEIPVFEAVQEKEIQRLVLRASAGSEYGKRQRWLLEKIDMQVKENRLFSRNQLLDNDVRYIANKHHDSSDILHEYFIPQRHFNAYLDAVKPLLRHSDIDLLNITVRAVNKDTDSLMNYADEDVFGFVYLFNQKKTPAQEQQMETLTRQLVDVAIKYHGTYYLPYRLHISREKMREAYPQADDFFRLKRKYDPNELFDNKFYQHYQ